VFPGGPRVDRLAYLNCSMVIGNDLMHRREETARSSTERH
jgi:hypothetical protein